MKKIMFNDNYGLTKAVLEGRKTMTRRIIPEKYGNVLKYYEKGVLVVPLSCIPDDVSIDDFAKQWMDSPGRIRFVPVKEEAEPQIINCLDSMLEAAKLDSRYKIGEQVSIAQSYKYLFLLMRQFPKIQNTFLGAIIKAHDLHPESIDDVSKLAGWSNKMFVRAELMPHCIEITDIRVERLQDITEEDCLREGIEKDGDVYSFNDYEGYKTPQLAFKALINRVSGRGTWEMNPYVFAYTFELVQ